MVKHILLSLMLIVMAAGNAMASAGCCPPPPEGKSKEQMFREIQEFKMKFLAQEMDLKEDQQQKFFELYDEMSRKRFAAMKSARELERKVKKNADATEADYQAVTDAWNKAKTEDAAIAKEYDEKFSKFLTQKQIFQMKSAEDKFRKKMEELRHKGRKGHNR